MSSHTSENMFMLHGRKSREDNVTTIITSYESHLHWKNHFQRNLIFFRIYADFEANNEKVNSCIGN